jgi:hypothetical protein
MSIYIRVGIDLAETRERLRAMSDGLDGLDDNDLKSVAALAMQRIKVRTKKGHDASGKPFAPYRPGTARSRNKRGRTVDRVTLLDSGYVQEAMKATSEDGVGVVYFTVSKFGRIAHWHNTGTRRMAQRRWLDFDDGTPDLQALANEAARKLAKKLEQK